MKNREAKKAEDDDEEEEEEEEMRLTPVNSFLPQQLLV